MIRFAWMQSRTQTTLVAFVAARGVMAHWIRPHLIAAAHQDLAITSASVVGYGSSANSIFDLGSPSTLQLAPPNIPGAWIYSTQLVDQQGHAITDQFLRSTCRNLGAFSGGGGSAGSSHRPAPAAAQNALSECAARVAARFHELVAYQPASRYWTFQWYELAIFLGAALALAWFCVWYARRIS